MRLALYDPSFGYYRRPRERVGFAPGTDFFTAASSGTVFGELVVASVTRLLRERGADPAAFTFVEIGAERGGGVLAGQSHPFAASQVVRVGEELELNGSCVVFSNELFDAQPCARYVRDTDGWAEVHVRLVGAELREATRVLERPPAFLPADAPVGYRFDAPLAAATLVESIAAREWRGLFVAFDYGKTLAELTSDTPQGTARAYWRHRQSNELLARVGEQDLTCHVCWDWLAAPLARAGFDVAPVEAQEAFLVRHAGDFLARAMTEDAQALSQRKLSLLQLLHPAHLGRKFQVLRAWRT